MRYLSLLLLAAVAAVLTSAPGRREGVGALPDGGFLLNSGWRLSPAGRQVPLDTLPMASAVSRDGKRLVVLNAGYLPPSLSVIDIAGSREVSRTPIPDGWLGLAFSPDGAKLYVGGAAQASVFEFAFQAGALKPARTFEFVPKAARKPQDFIGDVCLSPDGRTMYAADLFHDSIVMVDLASGSVVRSFKTGSRPYRLRLNPGGKDLFVSSWAGESVYRHDATTGEITGMVRVGPHPTDLAFAGGRLFVAAANTNSVYEISKDLSVAARINVSLTPRQPVGMTPSALAVSPDGSRLYVACSDANALAVVDISGKESSVAGFIPTGWYPTDVRVLADSRLLVLNARGQRSFPNPEGPNPGKRDAETHIGLPEDHQYIARIQTGSASLIDVPDAAALESYTDTVLRNCPYRDRQLDNAGVPAGNPVPARPGAKSPIRHVLYIVKENRTYDQVLGDMKKGAGDPSLTLFGEDVTPNQHKIAREFVLFDNFYVNADVSADGHNWSTAAISPDYVEKMWGTSYGQRRRSHDYYGPGDVAAKAPGGYIWDRVANAGLSIRNYGYYVDNRRTPTPDGNVVAGVGDPVLANYTCPTFRGFDLNYPEYRRAESFLEDLAAYEKKGELPAFMIMHLGRNHTAGTGPGRVTPQAMVADNDYAVGLVVEGLSKSKFWNDTAIFILEDDAQNGPDHIDAHRSTAFVVSPYTRRAVVDSTMYNTASMLRTMELILGVAPMTTFDAGARPMWTAFSERPDVRPYSAEKPRISLDERNGAPSATSARSERYDFRRPDEADDDDLNDILWRAIRGGEPPAPVHSAFLANRYYHANSHR